LKQPSFIFLFCRSAASNIRIFNPGLALFIALQMLIFGAVGLQIRLNGAPLGSFGSFDWICNPVASNIRIFNPHFALFIALQMLIFGAVGLQIQLNGRHPTERHPTERESD